MLVSFLDQHTQIVALFVHLAFLGQAFTMMLVYVWSRRNPYIRMNFFGLMNFQVSLFIFTSIRWLLEIGFDEISKMAQCRYFFLCVIRSDWYMLILWFACVFVTWSEIESTCYNLSNWNKTHHKSNKNILTHFL